MMKLHVLIRELMIPTKKDPVRGDALWGLGDKNGNPAPRKISNGPRSRPKRQKERGNHGSKGETEGKWDHRFYLAEMIGDNFGLERDKSRMRQIL
jgi:hypothetical protein